MASAEKGPAAPITLEQLAALNDEIAALTRAGIPLEEGLLALGGDLPGRLGKVSKRIAQRMAGGEPLLTVLADPAMGLPPVYRAVVAAGVRSGRLTSALESVAGSMRRLVQMRETIMAASLYPVLVLMTACAMLAVFCVWVAPPLAASLAAAGAGHSRLLAALIFWGSSAIYWGPVVPLVIFASYLLGCRGMRSAWMVESRHSAMLWGWLPGLGPMLRASQLAVLAETLAVLVENRVPLPEACSLAADVSSPKFKAPLEHLAAALLQGRNADALSCEGLPPRLRWTLAVGANRRDLGGSLRGFAESCQRHSAFQVELAGTLLPILFTVVIGGGAVLGYASLLFLPYTTLLQALS